MVRSTTGLIAGPLLFAWLLLLPVPDGMESPAMCVAAVAVLMAVWWITEAIPLSATALLPIFLFPVMGVMDGSAVTQPYANHLIYLFLGGFLIAVSIEKWNLHKRIALHTLRIIGISPRRMVLGFMLATAFLSMWISNTAATMMMLTIGLAVLHQITEEIDQRKELEIDTRRGHFRFGTSLMLGIGYSASIGGVATLVGTPPNAIFAGVLEKTYGMSISFLDWMMFGLPLAMVMLVFAWLYLTRFAYPSEIDHLPGGRELVMLEIKRLGPMLRQEKQVLLVFGCVAVLWILRGLFDLEAFRMIKDSTIAIGGAMLLFVIPSDLKKREFLLDWKTAVTIPWDILILFGGGFALAQGFSDSGLTHFLAQQLSSLVDVNIVLVVAAVTTLVIFLTEITSNTATATLSLPIMAALAGAMQVHPYGLMISSTLAASFAFMLPVATPPNAIVFSSRYIEITQMVRAGIWLNLFGVVLITTFVVILLPLIWGIDISALPPEFVSR